MSTVHSNKMEVDEAFTLLLRALSWILSDTTRANRFFGLTGVDPQELRERAEDPSLLVACVSFLEGYEPDLIACSEALGCAPEKIVTAARMLDE